MVMLPAMIARARSVVVVAPHPDDEILGCGNLMHALSEAGTGLTVVWLTDGGASHGPISAAARAALVATRADEALRGLQEMAIDCTAIFLNLPDGELGDPLVEDEAVALLREIVAAQSADAVLVTDGADDHPDHRAAFRIGCAVPGPALFSYAVSARYDGAAPGGGTHTLMRHADDQQRKRRALACHASQQAAGGAIFPMTEAAIDRFCAAPEQFRCVRGAAA